MEIGLRQADGDKLSRIVSMSMGLGKLEQYIASDPAMCGVTLLIVGR